MKEKVLSKRKEIFIYGVIIIYLIYTVYAYAIGNLNRISGQYEYQLKETGLQIAGEINGRMTDALSTVKALAQTYQDCEDIHSAEAVDTLVRISKQTGFTRMWLTKLDGTAVSSEATRSDASGREYLEDAQKGNSGISKVQISRVNGEKNVVIYAPIYKENKVIGLLIGIYALDQLADIIDISCFDGTGQGQICDADGMILVRQLSDEITNKTENLFSFWETVDFEKGKTIDQVRTDFQYQHESSLLYKVNGQKHDGYYCPVGINDWMLYVSLPNEIITAYTTENVTNTAVLCAKFVVLLVLVLLYRYRARNRELRRQAQIDGLTGLYNRVTAEEKITRILENKQQAAGTEALLVFDIDKFKLVNDTFGHPAGDELLKVISHKMQEQFEEKGILGRFGGDEFVIYLTEIKDRKTILEQASDFTKSIENLKITHYPEAHFSVSLGAAFLGEDGREFKKLYRTADERMYNQKRKGGNGVTDIDVTDVNG